MDFKEVIKQKEFRSPQAKVTLNIMYTAKWLEQIIHSFLKAHDLSGEQYNVLRILRGHHPEAYALQEIRDRMLNRWSNVSRLVDKLKQKGYLTRRPMKSNRRKVEIRITEKGLRFLEELDDLPIAGDLFDNALPAGQAEQLSDLLDEFRAKMETLLEEES